jgi:hypothetical protein
MSHQPRTVNHPSPSLHYSITPFPQVCLPADSPLFSAIALPPRLVGENTRENHSYSIVSQWYDLSPVPDRSVSPHPDANGCGRAFFSGIGLLPRLEGRYNGEKNLYTVISPRYGLQNKNSTSPNSHRSSSGSAPATRSRVVYGVPSRAAPLVGRPSRLPSSPLVGTSRWLVRRPFPSVPHHSKTPTLHFPLWMWHIRRQAMSGGRAEVRLFWRKNMRLRIDNLSVGS